MEMNNSRVTVRRHVGDEQASARMGVTSETGLSGFRDKENVTCHSHHTPDLKKSPRVWVPTPQSHTKDKHDRLGLSQKGTGMKMCSRAKATPTCGELVTNGLVSEICYLKSVTKVGSGRKYTFLHAESALFHFISAYHYRN